MEPAALDKLESIVGAQHVLTAVSLSPYVIEGRTPDAAVRPGTTDEVRAIVRLADELRIPLMTWGGGTASAVGAPASWTGLVLDLRRLNRVLEHEPGDLTVTVEAGITMAALQASLAKTRQWLSLDPPDADRATIGGIIAANASGPRRHLYGTARDLVIGVSVVTADGALVRGGGKVVKNVAGYDLPKLFVGSYGTLGVIVDATLRLRPVPDEERFVVAACASVKEAGLAARALATSDLIPTAIELVDGDASRALGVGAPAALVVGFDGVAEQVDWQCGELARLVSGVTGRSVDPFPPDRCARLGTAARDAFDAPVAVMRLSVLPTHVAGTMEDGASAARRRGFVSAWSAHAGVGDVTAALAATGEQHDVGSLADVVREWRDVAHVNGGHATLEWAPLALKAAVPVWDDPGAALRAMKRIKEQVDPNNVLNPGRFVGGM